MNEQGQEILVIDADPKVQRGIDQMLRAAGLLPTVLSDVPRALELTQQKFFAVAVVDLDTPGPAQGLQLVSALRERSPNTAVIAMAARRSFEVAVNSFRTGVDDVVVKAPDQVEYLRERVLALAEGRRRRDDNEQLLEQVAALHDDFFKTMLEMHKKIVDHEEGTGAVSPPPGTYSVLLVDDDGWLGAQLGPILDEKGGYALTDVATGGEALDVAGRGHFQIALVKEALMDLPGSMVARTIKQQTPDTIVLLYVQPQGPRPGKVEVIDTQRAIPFIPAFVAPRQLVERLSELGEAYHATTRERRYLASFRQQHFELLKRYQEAKSRLHKAGQK